MKVYNYNVRCRLCKKGFNPKKTETASQKLCPSCLSIRKEQYKAYKEQALSV
ncbi:MAG: hypothetical protein JW791_00070 [Nanoarchaeota archaeon]|nr:hypothetical protein [Nanoarchaeota archaeon]